MLPWYKVKRAVRREVWGALGAASRPSWGQVRLW